MFSLSSFPRNATAESRSESADHVTLDGGGGVSRMNFDVLFSWL